MPQKKVSIISGINGFVGKHLSDKLLAEGHQVAGIPRDLLVNPVGLSQYLLDADPDYIFHLAAYGNHSTQTEEDEIFVSNIFKTYNLLRAADATNYKAFINVSTSSVYGNHALRPMSEGDTPEPTSFYSTTKLISELLSEYFKREHGKRIINVRPFSIYGEGEADFRFIPTVCNSLLEDKEFDLYPDPVHDWIYVKDFVDAMYRLAVSKVEVFGSVNIGTGNQSTNQEIVNKLADISGKKSKHEIRQGGRKYDSTYWCADTEKLFRITNGWRPKFNLDEGLRFTYAYYQQGHQKKDN